MEYYFFVGCFIKGEDGLEEVLCNDVGVFFMEVVVEEILEEIGGFEGCVMLLGMEVVGLRSMGFYFLDEYEEIFFFVI